MAKHATKRENIAWPAEILSLLVKLGGLPAQNEREDEAWFDHVRAGEFFNRAVANARLASYFESAVSDVFPATRTFALRANETVYDLDYIVPGDVPEAEADRLAYWLLFQSMKAQDETVEEVRRAVRRFESNSWRHVIADQNNEKEPSHVER